MPLYIHQITACSHSYCSWIEKNENKTKKKQACRRQHLYSSSTTAVAWQNCSLPDVFARLHEIARVPLQISGCITLPFYGKGAQRNTVASVIGILFVIRMCLLSWELGADEIIPLQASHKCVGLVQHSRCQFRSAHFKRTITETLRCTQDLKMS